MRPIHHPLGILLVLVILSHSFQTSRGQERDNLFVKAANHNLEKIGRTLNDVCPLDDRVTRRILIEYGAMFVANGVKLPRHCILDNEADIVAFQSIAKPMSAAIGGVTVTLQGPALDALLAAANEAKSKGFNISPRGGATASARSFNKTVELWQSRFVPGLNHWMRRGRISRAQAQVAQAADIPTQAAMVFDWEEKHGYYFSTDFSKSILQSVAMPGASQHNFMLAIDIAQFGDKRVRRILADWGWFQTVKSDLPHFTYLGIHRDDLKDFGLVSDEVNGQEFWVPNL